jgi:hypothetical protein
MYTKRNPVSPNRDPDREFIIMCDKRPPMMMTPTHTTKHAPSPNRDPNRPAFVAMNEDHFIAGVCVILLWIALAAGALTVRRGCDDRDLRAAASQSQTGRK